MFQSSAVTDSGKKKTKRQAAHSKIDTAALIAKVIILLLRKSGLVFVWFLCIKVLELL